MNFEEYRQHDATGLAALVASGEVTADTLLALAIERTEAVNGRLNALLHPLHEHARRQLSEGVSGPRKFHPTSFSPRNSPSASMAFPSAPTT